VPDQLARLAQQLDGVGVPVALIGVGKVVADVLETGGAQQGVGDCVGEHVGVGVTEEPVLGRDLHAAEDELAARVRICEGVGVYA
jgi:hypothetical protein